MNASVISEKMLFQELHDISLELGQPLVTVLVSSQETCRICCKTLIVENKVIPVVIFSSYRGTYLGSCVTKVCRRCKVYEHYGYWTHGRKKHFTKDNLQLEFLLSTEDTAFEFAFLHQYSQFLISGALTSIIYYPTLLPRVQISRETSTNNRYLYSPHSSRPREVQNLGKSEFWEKKSLDNKSLTRRFGV